MINAKKNIFFVITSLEGGGAEKFTITLLKNFNHLYYNLFLIVFNNNGPYKESIPDYVQIIDFKKTSRYKFFNIIFKLSKLIDFYKPDTIFSILEYTNLVVYCAKLFTKFKPKNIIFTVHAFLSLFIKNQKFGFLKNIIYKLILKKCNTLIVPSNGVKIDLINNYNISNNQIKIIHNAIDITEITKLSEEDLPLKYLKSKPYIIAVGRLHKEKDYPTLIKAFSIISDSICENLLILGTGEDHNSIKQIIFDLNLENRIELVGFQINPYKFIKHASALVLSSKYESFGIVITEAMALGVPVVSTDCPSGPKEIINDGAYGLLTIVSNPDDLAQKIKLLLTDQKLKENIIKNSHTRVMDFDIDSIVKQYENLID